ncbi:rCG24640, isoform CRA_f [Rattus norvegicus]|uniref:RCG24640, isoform CRA_f n=1 Tax=Rattus norvegicus TaxID=10116 RepID=A6JBP5_RAT|nr:rCG24640, isoform CRA_f [Rattus norvegicus]
MGKCLGLRWCFPGTGHHHLPFPVFSRMP